MRIVRVLGAVGVAAAMVFGLAAGASAKASGAVCDKVSLTEMDLGGLGGKKFSAAPFKKAAKAFKAGAKVAPAKVKSAMTTMASYYRKLAAADSANDAVTSLTPSDTTKYAKASVVWGTFVATQCS